ncbi:MAG: chemotaxis protein CheB [Desulfuromonadaceae bacterium]|nr:chemotaxis protein CheB [Desulfuromonadaceae bacterium]MDD2847373.1 chemotaxis protein CheB [Desulfuromonadaceae bacterium]MDD4131514.1 chemotaxis protein CheB [Desulfuromonadaceae bacterium]
MQKNSGKPFKAVVIGVSTGGVTALKILLGALPVCFSLPIMIVSHIAPDSDDGLAVLLDTLCAIRVKEADEQENIVPGTAYLAPANYHLLVERGGTLALSVDQPVNFARPSVDVLFESAAEAYGAELIGIILTGAGIDGSHGLLKIKDSGGFTIVQDPVDAVMDSMPRHALQLLQADHVAPLTEIPALLVGLTEENK